MIRRLIEKVIENSLKSVLLLGPRQVGKSTLLESLKPDLEINFSNQATYLDFASNPNLLNEIVSEQKPKTVLIDEIQRLPSLLNTIQSILDSREYKGKIKFYLSGSSARKLRRGQANLLPGRLFSYELGGLCAKELNYKLDVNKALTLGVLPEPYLIRNKSDGEKLLRTYSGVYLKEEIQAEALTRNLEGFVRFIQSAAQFSGQLIDFTKLGHQAKISRMACKRFYEILEDTLIAYRCDSFEKVPESAVVKHPKYYFFDPGVLNGLLNNFNISNDRKGHLFEHLVISQLLNSAKANDSAIKIYYFRTRDGLEVDLIVELEDETWAIEVKTGAVHSTDLKGLQSFSKKYPRSSKNLLVITPDSTPRKIESIRILGLNEALRALKL